MYTSFVHTPLQRVAASPVGLMLYYISIMLVYITLVVMDPRLLHWFAVPVIVSGIVIGPDVSRWMSKRYDLFDVRALISLFGVMYFFLAPLLLVFWDAGVEPPYCGTYVSDYRPYLGVVASLHLIGLILFYKIEAWASAKPFRHPPKQWVRTPGNTAFYLALFVFICFCGHLYWMIKTGGVMTRLDYDDRYLKSGQGFWRLFAYALPIIATIFATVLRKTYKHKASFIVAIVILVLAFAWSFIFFGLAGSRSNTIWPFLWILMIIHYFWRRIPLSAVVLGFFLFAVFMFGYTFYKWGGVKQIESIVSQGIGSISSEIPQRIQKTVVGDMSRSYVQAYQAYVLIDHPYQYQLRWGKTIYGDIAVQFPRWIWLNEYNGWAYSGKVKAGTDMMMGPGHLDPDVPYTQSRFQYGLSGQMMMNFGLISIPVGFALWGWLVGKYRRWISGMQVGDMRYFIVPPLSMMLFLVLMYDFGNLITFAIFRLALPLVIIFLCAKRIRQHAY